MQDELNQRPGTPEPDPPPAAAARWFHKRWGSWLLGLGGFLCYFLVGVIFPGIVLGVWLVMKSGVGVTPQQVEDFTAAYVPHLLAWGAMMSLSLVGLLQAVRWLAPAPSSGAPSWARLLWIVGLAAACLAGAAAIGWLQGMLGWEVKEQEVIVRALAKGGIAFYLAGILVAPLGEEFVFRRFLFNTLRVANGRVVAYAVSALLFALIHFNLPGTPAYLWMAICFTVAYERTGSIWGAVAVHALNNSVAFLMQSVRP